MKFSKAIDIVLNGGIIRRKIWEEDKILKASINEKDPLLIIETENNEYNYYITNNDIFANDWISVFN